MAAAVELTDVSYRYPKAEKTALNDVSLSIEKGRMVMITGPSGAGKTTLGLTLNGLIPQLLEGELAGRVVVEGKDLSKYRVQTMSKQIGLVLQDPETQIFGRTVEEDTAFGPRNFLFSREEISSRVENALAKVGLKGFEKRNTTDLSGGEKQRLAIAGILAMEPEILVLDEPTAELDPAGREEILDALDALRRDKNLTIIVIEHPSEEIIKRADEVIVFNDGRIAWRGVPGKLFRDIALLERLSIKPMPVSLLGWNLYQKGQIAFDEIPLDAAEAEKVLRRHWNDKDVEIVKSLTLEEKKNSGETGQELVRIKDLVYRYHSKGEGVLKGISLSIHKGEFIAIVGSNGAGKTTLTKHLNGLLKPSGGDVIVEGVNTRDLSIDRLSRTIGYIFQNPDHQIFSATVEKELEFGLKNAGFNPKEIHERIKHVLNRTGLEHKANVHPYTLGKGERQMIAVAAILALNPKVAVIDEPTTGLDWKGVQKIMGLIAELHANGSTIVMISHDMDVVSRYAERVIVMKDGEILQDGKTKEVFTSFEVLRQAQVIPPQMYRLKNQLKDLGVEA